ncbi:hypothetical protein [Actinocorallia longicatena]|uniref:Uncharacterized protein n=1 Tax=Actinocorallia longicatena TaxID=111803 RepID=A0ABP6Q6T5_9ACTN
MDDIAKAPGPTGTAPATEDDGPAGAVTGIGFLLLLPAAIVLHLFSATGWAAWTSLAAGTLGIAMIVVAAVLSIRDRNDHTFSPGVVIGIALIASKFVHGAWTFLS